MGECAPGIFNCCWRSDSEAQIQKNIHHFGGDGSRVTAAGESAGAVSILCHLRGQVPGLFQNAFIMSAANISPDTLATRQRHYDHLVSSVGLKDAPPSLHLSALRNMSPFEMLDKLGVTEHSFMLQDEEFFSDYSGQQFDQFTTFPSWIQRVVVGQTKQETAVFAPKWYTMSADQLRSQWEKTYSDPVYAQEVFAAYGIDKASSHSDMVAALVAYTSDNFFTTTASRLATEHLKIPGPTNPKVHHYCFDQPDILSSRLVWRDSAYHSVDIPFLFCHPQVASDDAPPDFRKTSDNFSASVLHLVNGHEPWEDVGVARRWMRFNGDKSSIVDEHEGLAARWSALTDSPDRYRKFMLGMILLGDAMGYALNAFSPEDLLVNT